MHKTQEKGIAGLGYECNVRKVHQPNTISSPSPPAFGGRGDATLVLEGPAETSVLGGPIRYGRSCAGRSELPFVIVVPATVSALLLAFIVAGASGLTAARWFSNRR